MVTFVAVAHESNKEFDWHGQDVFYFVSGKTLKSAKNRFLKTIKSRWAYYEYEFRDKDITDYLDNKFMSDCSWEQILLLPDTDIVNFIYSKHAGIVEIGVYIYDLILKYT